MKPRNPGDLEKVEDLVVAHLKIRTASRSIGQEVCIRPIQHIAAVLGTLNAKADAESHVGADAVVNNALRLLHRQNKVDAKRSAFLGHAHEFAEDLTKVVLEAVLELCELVDDDKQVGERFSDPKLMELLDVGNLVTGQDLLAPRHLASKCHQRPACLSTVQIGDDANSVGKIGQHRHGGATLVINQDEVDLMRMVVKRQCR